jgi:cytochrome c biogenesis protein CcmG, thiol:disulfide interchange protein DsbE
MRKKLLLVIAIALLSFSSPAFASADIGKVAPALIATQLDGRSFDLSAQRGKVAIVNFWATWCVPCRQEMPALDAVYKKYRAKGLVMIGVSADRAKHRDDVAGVMKEFSYPAAMLEDAQNNGFGIPEFLPVTYIVGKNGTVSAILTPDGDPVTEQNLDKVLRPLLGP